MKFTKTKITCNKDDFSQIIFIRDGILPSQNDSITFMWNDNIAKYSKENDFEIVDKNGWHLTNVGVRIPMDSKFLKTYFYPNIKEIKYNKIKDYNQDGKIANIINLENIPVPFFVLSSNDIALFRNLMDLT